MIFNLPMKSSLGSPHPFTDGIKVLYAENNEIKSFFTINLYIQHSAQQEEIDFKQPF